LLFLKNTKITIIKTAYCNILVTILSFRFCYFARAVLSFIIFKKNI